MKQSCIFRQWDREKACEKDVIGCQDKHESRQQYFHHSVIERVKRNSQVEWNLSTNSLGVPISSRGGINRGRILVSGCWRRVCKGVCELGEKGSTPVLGTGREGRNVCWKIVHLACTAEGSRLFLALPVHWKHCPKAGYGERELQAACPFLEGAAWWLEKEFWEALSSLLVLLFGRFPLCKKNNLQHYPVRHISSVVCI